jgi:hypothetical protein
MNNATVDCANFVTAVDKIIAGEETKAAAINEYEKEVIDRGSYEASLSRQLTLNIHYWDRFLESPIMKYGGNLARQVGPEQESHVSVGAAVAEAAA